MICSLEQWGTFQQGDFYKTFTNLQSHWGLLTAHTTEHRIWRLHTLLAPWLNYRELPMWKWLYFSSSAVAKWWSLYAEWLILCIYEIWIQIIPSYIRLLWGLNELLKLGPNTQWAFFKKWLLTTVTIYRHKLQFIELKNNDIFNYNNFKIKFKYMVSWHLFSQCKDNFKAYKCLTYISRKYHRV